MKYLIETTEVYRVDTEDEVTKLIEDAKKKSTVSKCNYTHKEKKLKGEVVDEWFKVSITKKWDNEKEPCGAASVFYGTESAFNED